MLDTLPVAATGASERSHAGADRHLLVRLTRKVAVQRAQEVQMAAGRLALLLHADPENDAEISRWLSILSVAGAGLQSRVNFERTLRDIGGIA